MRILVWPEGDAENQEEKEKGVEKAGGKSHLHHQTREEGGQGCHEHPPVKATFIHGFYHSGWEVNALIQSDTI